MLRAPMSDALPFFTSRRVSVLSADDERLKQLSAEIDELEATLTPLPEHIKEKDEFLERLQETVSGAFDSCLVSPFGSVVNGLWTPHSDIDICLQMPGCTTRPAQIKVLRRVAAELHRITSHYLEPRFQAKMPIIHWAPRVPGAQVACDISVNNTLAIVNSKLIGAYMAVDRRLRAVGLALKHWAKSRGINDRSRGTLSSFALILMLIHLFQKRPVPILPGLQDLATAHSYAPVYINGADCRYCTNRKEIEEELAFLQGGHAPNSESVGYLLYSFFRHFGYDYKHGIIAVRDTTHLMPAATAASASAAASSTAPGLVPTDPSMCYLFVDNPFEVGKDVANVLPNQYARIRQEFRRAHTLMAQGAPFAEICKNDRQLHDVLGKPSLLNR